MSKMISFRELIDLEPKPKKVIYNNEPYKYNGEEYIRSVGYNFEPLLESLKTIHMSVHNIEIIEEDKPLIEPLTDTAYSDETFGYNWDKKETILKNKLNEIIDYINSKGDK